VNQHLKKVTNSRGWKPSISEFVNTVIFDYDDMYYYVEFIEGESKTVTVEMLRGIADRIESDI
jgi:hypothetical protein